MHFTPTKYVVEIGSKESLPICSYQIDPTQTYKRIDKRKTRMDTNQTFTRGKLKFVAAKTTDAKMSTHTIQLLIRAAIFLI